MAAGIPQPLFRRDSALPFQTMDSETIVVDPRTREVHLLNETAARIWDLLETEQTLPDLLSALASEYQADGDDLQREVETFVAALTEKGLVKQGPAPAAPGTEKR
jgi:PqqD family protein of HPr-rel-A system